MLFYCSITRVLFKEKGSRVNPKDSGVHIRGKAPNARAECPRGGRAREGGVPPLGGEVWWATLKKILKIAS